MTVTSVDANLDRRVLTVVSDFRAPASRVWALWEDARSLERWWGPPGWPATFTQHRLEPGAKSVYFMTGPEGDRHYGWWTVTGVREPDRLEFEDGFGDEHGTPSAGMPTSTVRVGLAPRSDGGTTMTIETTFPTRDDMQKLMDMGMQEGLRAALGQMDALLAEAA
ncbi:MAG: SRPBCC domain-containing protein [Thermoleophilia bacterium]